MKVRVLAPIVVVALMGVGSATCSGQAADAPTARPQIEYRLPASPTPGAARIPSEAAALTAAASPIPDSFVAVVATPTVAAVRQEAAAATPPPTSPPAAEPTAPPATVAPPPGPAQFAETLQDETFSSTSLAVKVNQPVTISVQNNGQEMHDWALCQGTNCGAFIAKSDLLSAGKRAQVTFTLPEAGSYTFECEVHPKTMVGTLVVN